ncbi:abortive infection family protein [Pseudomonas lundensis]|uniref:abortive infection family protein n=1 Tax=Pseudomonas lundensis TaxID=86185 RepID=UPI0035283903
MPSCRQSQRRCRTASCAEVRASILEERDLQEIVSVIVATVNGIGASRTHANSAHGAGKRPYKLKPRHARMAIHAAHTIAAFTLETWDEKSAQT